MSELSRWLIIEAHATIKQVKKMRDFYSWMQAPPRMSQIKQDWARFKTSLTKEISPNGTQHKKTTLSEEEKFAYDQLIQTTGQ